MNHSFDVDLAVKYGIEEAIIIENLAFWIKKNVANNTNLIDGSYWTYNSLKAFNKLFPYINSRKIARILEKLEKLKIIKSGNHNKKKYDRTKWYCLIEKTVLEKYQIITNVDNSSFDKMTNGFDKMTNALCQNVKPIPDINTDINTDIKPCHGELGIFEKLFKELKINFTRKNQESVKKLLMKMSEQEVLNYLKETHNNLQTDKTIKNIGGVFSKKIALGERQTQIKAKADEIAIENISTTNEIDYRGFNRKQKISLIEKELTTIEKNELKEKIRLGLTSELEFYDEEALNKIVTEELESVLIRRFNKKYLTK